jgi:glucokinase
MAQDYVLGVDIGGTNTALGLVDRAGRLLASSVLPTRGKEAAPQLFLRLHAEAARLREGLPGRLRAAGVGAPNAHAGRCTLEHPPNLAWGVVDLKAELAPLGVPVAATNDANAAALGELAFGAARGMRDVLVLTLGTGLGCGLVANGALVEGATGFAGELGHVNAVTNGRPCGCGLKGCLETYASATGLLRTVREWLEDGARPSRLRELPPERLDARAIAEAAEAGDALAQEAFAFTGELLGRKLADAAALTSPEAVFLLGGLAAAGELLFAPVRQALEAHLYPPLRGSVKLLASGIPGNAAVLGAAALAWRQIEGPLPR